MSYDQWKLQNPPEYDLEYEYQPELDAVIEAINDLDYLVDRLMEKADGHWFWEQHKEVKGIGYKLMGE